MNLLIKLMNFEGVQRLLADANVERSDLLNTALALNPRMTEARIYRLMTNSCIFHNLFLSGHFFQNVIFYFSLSPLLPEWTVTSSDRRRGLQSLRNVTLTEKRFLRLVDEYPAKDVLYLPQVGRINQ